MVHTAKSISNLFIKQDQNISNFHKIENIPSEKTWQTSPMHSQMKASLR